MNLNNYCLYLLNTFSDFNNHNQANNLCVTVLLRVLFRYSVYVALEFVAGTVAN